MGGTPSRTSRMQDLAIYIRKILGVSDTSEPVDLAAAGHRYAVYKVGPVLCVSHGVGSSTMSETCGNALAREVCELKGK